MRSPGSEGPAGGIELSYSRGSSVASLLDSVNLGSSANISMPLDLAEEDSDEADDLAGNIARQLARQLVVKPDVEMPVYGSSGGNGWALDPMHLLHNAIRRELVDLYSCIMSMERRADFSVGEEIMELIIWWKTFLNLSSIIFEIETKHIVTVVFRTRKSGGGLQGVQDRLARSQQALRARYDEIEPLMVRFRDAPCSYYYDLMILKIDTIIKLTLEDLRAIEDAVGPMAVTHLNPAAMQSVETRVVTKVLEGSRTGDLFVMLLRPMASSQRRHFASKYLNSIQMSDYKAVWRIAFEQGHCAIPARFRKRFEQY